MITASAIGSATVANTESSTGEHDRLVAGVVQLLDDVEQVSLAIEVDRDQGRGTCRGAARSGGSASISASLALTFSAFDGFGCGVVSTQWLSRNRAPSPAAIGLAAVRELLRIGERLGFLNVYGVSSTRLVIALVIPGDAAPPPASFSAMISTRPPESIISWRVGGGSSGPS